MGTDCRVVSSLPHSILVVEDHEDSLRVTDRLLRLEGYDVHAAGSCAAALDAARGRRFDLVLCDIGLPDGDGCDLFAQLRAAYGLDGIVYSGWHRTEDHERAVRAGFAAQLLKPIPYPKLMAEIRAVLSRRPASSQDKPAA